MLYAPIIIFAFNRLEPLRECVNSLQRNSEAAESDLYVFLDGPRPQKIQERESVEAVRQYVKTITGFKSLHCVFSDENKGLGPSIIAGVSQVIGKYGKAIVLEDDLILSKNFLAYMNQGLERYEHEQKVFSVSGYGLRVKRPTGYDADLYFTTRSSSWGWATWRDRWASVDWQLEDWQRVRRNRSGFNRWAGSDCYKMLNDWREGRNKSWAIRFCYAQYVQRGLSLTPLMSKVDNEGFDGEGTNCKSWSRFRCDIDTSGQKDFRWPDRVELYTCLHRQNLRYHSIPLRLWSRLMYLIH